MTLNLIPVSYRPNRPTRTITLEAGVGKPGAPGRQRGRSMIFRAGSTELLTEADADLVKADATRQGIAVDFTFGKASPAPAPGVPAMKGAPQAPALELQAELPETAAGEPPPEASSSTERPKRRG